MYIANNKDIICSFIFLLLTANVNSDYFFASVIILLTCTMGSWTLHWFAAIANFNVLKQVKDVTF